MDHPHDVRETLSQASAATSAGQMGRHAQGEYYGEYDDNGVDVSLIRYMLRRTPLERLMLMEQHARDTRVLFEYGRRHYEAKAGQDR